MSRDVEQKVEAEQIAMLRESLENAAQNGHDTAGKTAKEVAIDICTYDSYWERYEVDYVERLILIERLERAEARAGHRDEKWMRGIEDACGRKICFDPLGRNQHMGPHEHNPTLHEYVEQLRSRETERLTLLEIAESLIARHEEEILTLGWETVEQYYEAAKKHQCHWGALKEAVATRSDNGLPQPTGAMGRIIGEIDSMIEHRTAAWEKQRGSTAYGDVIHASMIVGSTLALKIVRGLIISAINHGEPRISSLKYVTEGNGSDALYVDGKLWASDESTLYINDIEDGRPFVLTTHSVELGDDFTWPESIEELDLNPN